MFLTCSDYVSAEEFLWKALNIRRERDSEGVLTADSLFQLAFLIQKQGSKTRKKEAVELLQDCLDIRTHKLGNNTKVMFLYNKLGYLKASAVCVATSFGIFLH